MSARVVVASQVDGSTPLGGPQLNLAGTGAVTEAGRAYDVVLGFSYYSSQSGQVYLTLVPAIEGTGRTLNFSGVLRDRAREAGGTVTGNPQTPGEAPVPLTLRRTP